MAVATNPGLHVRLIRFCVPALLVSLPCALFAQNGRISGRTTDTAGNTLGSVSVTLLGTTLNAVSDANGNYFIQDVPAGSYTARATRSGYSTTIAPTVVTASQITQLNLVLDLVAPVPVLISSSAPASPIADVNLKLPVPDSAIIRSRQAGRIPFTPIVGARSILPLFSDTELMVEIHNITRTPTGYRASGAIIDRNARNAGSFVIVSRNDRITANVRHGLRLYQVRWQDGDVHLIVEVDRSKLPPGAG